MDGWNHISWMWKNISIFYITVPTSIKMFKFASKNANQFYSYVSNFNSLCYDIEPRVNKEKRSVLIYWKICWLFSRQYDLFPMLKILKRNKRKKVKNQKTDHYEEKSRNPLQQMYGLLNASSKPVAVSDDDFKHMPKRLFFYSHTF